MKSKAKEREKGEKGREKKRFYIYIYIFFFLHIYVLKRVGNGREGSDNKHGHGPRKSQSFQNAIKFYKTFVVIES